MLARTPVILLAWLWTAPLHAAGPVGVWQLTSTRTPAGKTYSGYLNIRAVGDVLGLAWATTAGKYGGLGFVREGKLLAGWGGDDFGVAVYKLTPDGTLVGHWTRPAEVGTTPGSEQADGGRKGEFGGRYTLTGIQPAGAGVYTGALVIAKQGKVYSLSWDVGGHKYSGVGLRSGLYLVAAWGAGSGVVAYELRGDTARGRWAVPTARRLGVENLKRAQR